MANDEHVALLKQGVATWNNWRDENRDIRSKLRKALREADLSGADLRPSAGRTSAMRTSTGRTSTRRTSVGRTSARRQSHVLEERPQSQNNVLGRSAIKWPRSLPGIAISKIL
jgi:hypothetical protein